MLDALRPFRASAALAFTLLVGSAFAVGCGSEAPRNASGTAITDGSGASGAGANGSGGELFAGGGPPAGRLTVAPATAIIDVRDGASQPVDLDARYDGNPVAATWVVDLSSVAAVDGDGVVSATNQLGGEVKVRADYNGESVEAIVTVHLGKVLNPAGATASEQATLKAAADPDGATQWKYPYDGTVFPKGLLAPELMWNSGGVDDLYYVKLDGKYADIEVYTTSPPPSRFALDEETWVQLTESGPGGKVALTVARLAPGAPSATVVASHTWTIANGSLKGTVYYWANSLGRVLRIKPGASAPEDFLAAGGQTGCSTCHSVSADGSTLVVGGDIGVSTWDLLSNSAVLGLPAVGKPVRDWAMPAVSPDGRFVVENAGLLAGPPGGGDGIWDAKTGAKLAGKGLDGIFLDMPAFAPDGTKLAFVDHDSHGLGVFDFDLASGTASNPKPLVDKGSDPDLDAIAFPSVSPDARWIVYHRGQWPESLDTRFGPGDLYLASADDPGLEVRLERTNGDPYPLPDRDRHYNYEPTFAPLNAGGFAWVVFTSRRTYGNRLTGNKASVKQLWVAAVDQSPQPGVDPSYPAFWVPGQDLATLNMRGFWALDPCKQDGAACESGSECCNQNCDQGICAEPDPKGCADMGNACSDASPCCHPLATCVNGFCAEPPPA